MKKAFLSILLSFFSLATILATIGCSSSPDYSTPNQPETVYSSLTYEKEANAYTVTGIDNIESIVKIPDMYNDLPVTKIAPAVFHNCIGIDEVVLPKYLSEIGASAFQNSSIEKIIIPNSVTIIGENAFHDCKNLFEVKLSNSIDTLSEYLFMGCTSLLSIDIPFNVKTISRYAFSSSGLKSISIPAGVSTIEDFAFFNCYALEKINITDTCPFIGYHAFNNTLWYNQQPDGVVYLNRIVLEYKGTMPANTTLTIKDGTYAIDNLAFYGESNLISISLPSSLRKIGTYAFAETGLAMISLPPEVIIDDGCFTDCQYLRTVIIPKNCHLDAISFAHCTNLTIYTDELKKEPAYWTGNFNLDVLTIYWAGEWQYINNLPTPNN